MLRAAFAAARAGWAAAAEAAAAARRRISLALARSVHAQPSAGPERPALQAAWVPLYLRLSALPPAAPSGSREKPMLRAAFGAAAARATAEAQAAEAEAEAAAARRPISLALARSVHAQPRAAFATAWAERAAAARATAEAEAEPAAARRCISLFLERSLHAQARAAWVAEAEAFAALAEAAEAAETEAARQRISLALARSVHAQPSADPERPALQAAWVPLYLRLSALPPAAPSGSVAAELDGWLRSRRPLSEEQLLAYVRKPCKFRHHKRALELMDWMEARGVNLQLRHHAIRVDLVSKVNGIQAAEEYFWSLPDILKSIKTYSSLLNCYAEHRKADKGLELYENMKAMNIVPNTLVYNNLMALYMKTGQPEKIPTTFEEMREGGIRADNFTYYVLTESYIMMNDLESAENVLEELKKATSVHWSLYTMMADNYNKRGQFDKAELTLKKAEEVMDKREMPPWHNLLSLYFSSGNLSEVKRIWESLKLAFKKCSNRSYLVMLSALRTLDDFDSLQKIFQEWVSTHEQYDMRIPNVVIKAYLDKGMIDEAEAIRQTAMAQGHFNEMTFYIFAKSYLEKSKFNAALEVWRDAKNIVKTQNWVPSKELVNRFLKHYEESKDVDGMELFCECLKKLECLDAEAYEALIRTYISAGRTNPSIAQRMEDDRVEIGPEMVEMLRGVSGG